MIMNLKSKKKVNQFYVNYFDYCQWSWILKRWNLVDILPSKFHKGPVESKRFNYCKKWEVTVSKIILTKVNLRNDED